MPNNKITLKSIIFSGYSVYDPKKEQITMGHNNKMF